MAEALNRCGEAVKAAVEYLQTIKIAEIRQTLELLGVQHFEIIAAVLLFVMLQFTKFTAVLLLACSIAYGTFYMWDTWFPEVKENYSTQNDEYGYLYGAPFWSSYGPSYGGGNLSRNSVSSGVNSNYDNTYAPLYRDPPTNRDARTSALFPPFSISEIAETLPGDHMYDSEEKRVRLSRHYIPRPDPFHQRKSHTSSSATPIAPRLSTNEVPKRLSHQISDENRRNRRDPLSFRRLIANDYRMYRPTTSADAQPYYNYTMPVPEERTRRLPGFFDDYKMKSRRTNDKRSTSHRTGGYTSEQPWNRQNERWKSLSRENILHRSRNIQESSPHRTGSPHGRSNAGNYNNMDSSRKKGRM
ncbi:hypothetical protein KR044_005223 [Drosophila immigrans]|nr:hypothetical protein KR044_005223 [Drosophila immigrans]